MFKTLTTRQQGQYKQETSVQMSDSLPETHMQQRRPLHPCLLKIRCLHLSLVKLVP